MKSIPPKVAILLRTLHIHIRNLIAPTMPYIQFLVALRLLIFSINVSAYLSHEAIKDCEKPVFVADENRGLAMAQRDGFKFENPSVDCAYTSQPKMYDLLGAFDSDVSAFFSIVHPDVDWTIVGHHPLAGHYPSAKLFFVNTLWRLRAAFDVTRIGVAGLHAGCNSKWSVQELDFHGSAKGGEVWQGLNVWVTRWENDRIVECRAYVDSPTTIRLLRDYEIWWNSTTDVEHTTFLPGPQGMPPI